MGRAKQPVPDKSLSNIARGRWGEDTAARHYQRAGYLVLGRNWRCRFGEIDLIAGRGHTLVIVEVKARRTAAYGPPSAAVGPAKQQRLRRLAAEWLRVSGVHADVVRFDVVAITGQDIDVFEAAF
jgi:putative endonuclease